MIETAFTKLVGIRHPIVQTGMGWVAGARLASATSAAGGLGILAAATMTLDELRAAISEVKGRTDAPFGVNLRTDQDDVGDRVQLLIDGGVRLASFATAPREDLVKRLRDAGVVTMPTVGAVRHAEKVAGWGVDAVIAQGHEGGGHTGPVATTLLLPAVTAAVDIPVLGAGGFYDGRGLVAALAYGAAGIAMGTRFLLTRESTVPDAVKQVYLDTPVTGTVVTTAIDGVPQRVIKTAAIDRLGRLPRAAANALRFRRLTGASLRGLLREGRAMRESGDRTWAQVVMAANAPMLTRQAMVDGRLDAGILPTGQAVGVIDALPSVAAVIESVMSEADATLARLRAI
ncbi:MAG TPA: nitronate monooxygenase [Acidimicrobiales bacterium]|nr:nitronate monooxygenase [Acidimicrobiales bacterium]